MWQISRPHLAVYFILHKLFQCYVLDGPQVEANDSPRPLRSTEKETRKTPKQNARPVQELPTIKYPKQTASKKSYYIGRQKCRQLLFASLNPDQLRTDEHREDITVELERRNIAIACTQETHYGKCKRNTQRQLHHLYLRGRKEPKSKEKWTPNGRYINSCKELKKIIGS